MSLGGLGRAGLHPSAKTTDINPLEGRQSSLTDQLLCSREAWNIFWVLEARWHHEHVLSFSV